MAALSSKRREIQLRGYTRLPSLSMVHVTLSLAMSKVPTVQAFVIAKRVEQAPSSSFSTRRQTVRWGDGWRGARMNGVETTHTEAVSYRLFHILDSKTYQSHMFGKCSRSHV
jgi:hypothetical protein